MNLQHLASDMAKKLNKQAPTILTVVAGIGVVATAVLFARAGMQAEREVQHQTRVNEEYDDRYPTPQECAGMTWHFYLIPTSIAIATTTAFVCANALNQNRQAALIGAYALAERTWSQYRGKVQEMVGEHGETVIRQEAVKDTAGDRTPSQNLIDSDQEVYMDVFSGQMFNSDEDTIRRAMEFTNEKAEEDGFVNLNYFYDRIGARSTQIGELMGWSDGFPLDIILTPVQFENGIHGWGLDYARYPFMGYHEV